MSPWLNIAEHAGTVPNVHSHRGETRCQLPRSDAWLSIDRRHAELLACSRTPFGIPKAKVILSLRDSPDAWWKSFENTLGRMQTLSFLLTTLPLPSIRLLIRTGYTFGQHRLDKLYGGPLDPDGYNRHNDWVRSVVPREELLEFNVKEGWEPLCKFLDVPVPHIPFPHTNDTAAVSMHLKKARALGLVSWAAIFGCAGATWYWYRIGGFFG
ncbi:hypothetical protein CALCODRAFT_184575 [Calocera cornea HHB12733]|uniref:NAD dependent epimerase/dehydratase n=1 Tax=Calocera cornea HHB12733 TaxID=1353952 RepID=A0A165CAL2_9BASI|nr:hypothetical protein CALCODRAFT_184575 [Calocera cornea HHB12733]